MCRLSIGLADQMFVYRASQIILRHTAVFTVCRVCTICTMYTLFAVCILCAVCIVCLVCTVYTVCTNNIGLETQIFVYRGDETLTRNPALCAVNIELGSPYAKHSFILSDSNST